ncbi:hypothetical protein GQ54DRAFT_126801 [Martensiomyces pterosporus]|nr:hypothetical protein GQ54DRAFT_126801 [Martensiomyces pterosporus]
MPQVPMLVLFTFADSCALGGSLSDAIPPFAGHYFSWLRRHPNVFSSSSVAFYMIPPIVYRLHCVYDDMARQSAYTQFKIYCRGGGGSEEHIKGNHAP